MADSSSIGNKVQVSLGEDFIIEWLDRNYRGTTKTVFQSSGQDGSVKMGNLSVASSGMVSISALQLSGGIQLAVYSNTTRPSAASVAEGTMIFNSDDKAPNFSDGSAWRDAVGNLT